MHRGLRVVLILSWLLWIQAVWGSPAPDYAKADRHALRATRADESSLESLAAYLGPSSFSDAEKARAVYRWIADRIRYDYESRSLPQSRPARKRRSQEPEDVLRSRLGVCEGYSKLYGALAQRAGLESVYITGRSTASGSMGHAWNAVRLGGRWHLLDATWAAGGDDQEVQGSRFNDFWFCPPPEQFIYTHWPRASRWQLLSSSWSFERWRRAPKLSSGFFRYGMEWIEPDGSLPLKTFGEGALRSKVPAGVSILTELVDAQERKLPNATFSQACAGGVETRIRCPQPGTYTLRVACRGPQRKVGEWAFSLPVDNQGAAQHSFPTATSAFLDRKVELVGPWHGRLRPHSQMTFHLKAPGAVDAALYQGERRLSDLRVKDGSIYGTVVLPSQGKVAVYASYPEAPGLYHGLLTYELGPP